MSSPRILVVKGIRLAFPIYLPRILDPDPQNAAGFAFFGPDLRLTSPRQISTFASVLATIVY